MRYINCPKVRCVMAKVDFDVSTMPDCQKWSMMARVSDGIKELFARPGEEERFQDWLRERGLTETPVTIRR